MKCERCNDTGWIEEPEGMRACVCIRQRYIASQLGERFATACLEGLLTDVQARGRAPHPSLLAAMERIRERPAGSYFLHGDFGAWKTYLAACQFSILVNGRSDDLSRVRFYTEPDMAKMFRDVEMDRRPTITPISSSDVHAHRIQHVFIDDLGKRRVTDFIRDQYFDLINAIHRMSPKVGLTITSNASLGGLAYDAAGAEIYDPGMTRRIKDLCEVLEIRVGGGG